MHKNMKKELQKVGDNLYKTSKPAPIADFRI